MRKLIMLVAMLAMVLLVAAPAMAQSAGDNSNVCVGTQEVVNTGDVENDVVVDLAPADGEDNDLDGLIDELGEDFFEDLTADEFVEVIEALEEFNAADNGASIEELDLEIGGAELTVSPSNSTDCNQSVNQEAYALSY